MEIPKIGIANVKVMRSHDYCHFEVSLSSSETINPEAVDALRKVAARLVDKAVCQYRIAKNNREKRLTETDDHERLVHRAKKIAGIAECDRTVEQKAELKAFTDEAWAAIRVYNYEDDWEEDPDDSYAGGQRP